MLHNHYCFLIFPKKLSFRLRYHSFYFHRFPRDRCPLIYVPVNTFEKSTQYRPVREQNALDTGSWGSINTLQKYQATRWDDSNKRSSISSGGNSGSSREWRVILHCQAQACCIMQPLHLYRCQGGSRIDEEGNAPGKVHLLAPKVSRPMLSVFKSLSFCKERVTCWQNMASFLMALFEISFRVTCYFILLLCRFSYHVDIMLLHFEE